VGVGRVLQVSWLLRRPKVQKQETANRNRNHHDAIRDAHAFLSEFRDGATRHATIILLFLLRIALLANLAFFLRRNTAFVRAFLTRGFGLLAAGFGAREGDAAEERYGAED
jgi:hypothetical protein